MTAQLPYHAIKECFRRLGEIRPEPKGELEHLNAYTLLVAVALSAQATDKGVNRATRALFEAAGVDLVLLQFSPQYEEMERFSESVIARYRA